MTFFKWNIHEDYFLKVNSSDTIYLVFENPIRNETMFAIIENEDKQKLEDLVTNISFPKQKDFSNNVDDGLTYAFVYKTQHHNKKLSIHAKAGPKEFWKLGSYLENLKSKYKFKSINKKVNLKEIKELIMIPFPPKYK